MWQQYQLLVQQKENHPSIMRIFYDIVILLGFLFLFLGSFQACVNILDRMISFEYITSFFASLYYLQGGKGGFLGFRISYNPMIIPRIRWESQECQKNPRSTMKVLKM